MFDGVIKREEEPVSIGEVLHRFAVHRLECAHVPQDTLNALARVDRLAVRDRFGGRWNRIIPLEDSLMVEVLFHFLRCNEGEAVGVRSRPLDAKWETRLEGRTERK